MKHTQIITPIKNGWSAFIILVVTFLSFNKSKAQDLIEVSPITDKILLLYIEEGHMDTYGVGQRPEDIIPYGQPLNVAKAMNLSSYQIKSTDDSFYSTSQSPVNIGRKSKGIDYNNEDANDNEEDIFLGHWIYIELPKSMTPGGTYTISNNDVFENIKDFTFTFNVDQIRSETIHVNQMGFPTNSPKYAYLSQWMGDFNTNTHSEGGLELDDYAGTEFRVVNFSTGNTIYTGTIEKRLDKTVKESTHPDFGSTGNYTKADVWQCDFSSVTAPGEYKIVVDRMGRSFAFNIGNESTKEPFYYTMKGLFWQRQGVFKEQYDGKVIPADYHGTNWKWDNLWNPGDGHGLKEGDDKLIFPFDINRTVDVSGIYGYYFDAGDFDGYNNHSRVPMLLFMLYDLAPDQFRDGEIGNRYKRFESDSWIDEGNNGIPDLLDEASWLVKYGKRSREILKSAGGSGGVPLYVGRDGVTDGNGTPAWEDDRTWYVAREDPRMTFYHAGNSAYYAACLNEFYQLTNSGNHPEAASWIVEAKDAFEWSEKNIGLVTDTYKSAVRRIRAFAASALYKATGEAKYQTIFKEEFTWDPDKGDGEWANPNDIDVAAGIYALLPNGHPNLDLSFKNTIRDYVINSVETNKVREIQDNAFRQPIEDPQFIQLGGPNTSRMTLVPIAYELTNDKKYLDLMHNSYNYILGGNQMSMVFISGLGERYDDWIFTPNSYLTSDYNSMVYSSESFIGHTSYFSATFNTGYWFFNSIFSEFYSQAESYPDLRTIGAWPGTERKTYNRFSIQGGEFTVQQQNNHMAYTTGFVKAKAKPNATSYRLNERPTLSLNLTNEQELPEGTATLTSNASSDTRYVDYYYDWHFIGRSSDKGNSFRLEWDPQVSPQTRVLITAVAYDDKGRRSIPTAGADKEVIIGGEFIPVTSVEVTPSSLTMPIARTKQLTAIVKPENASNDKVNWSSNNTAVATVDENGKVTAVSIGSAQIKATTEDRNKTFNVNVTVVDLTCSSLLRNHSFESGLSNWTTNSGNPTTTTDAIEGSNALQLTGESGIEQKFSQPLSIGTNVVVRFSAKVNATAGWSGSGFDFKDAAGETIASINTRIASTDWQEYYVQLDAPAGTASINVWAYTSSDVLLVDNYCIDIEDSSSPGEDTQAPTVPNGLVSSSITETSFVLDWNVSTDNVGVDHYSIYIDGVYNKRSTDNNTTVSGLSSNTTYAITVSARDAAGNESSRSSALSVSTSGDGGSPGDAIDIEAEEFTTQSGTSTQSVGTWFTGTGYVDYGGNNSYAEWTTNLSGSSANLEFRYTNGSGQNRICDLFINGILVGTLDFPSSDGWGAPATTSFTGAAITEGANTIRLVANNTFNGGPNLDRLRITTSGGGSEADFTQDDSGLVSMEAEEATSQSNGTGSFASMSWQQQNDASASNSNFMIVPDNGNINSAGTLNGPRLDFVIDFVQTGTHYIWIRQKSPNGADNSIIPAFDDVLIADWNMPDALTEWTWSKAGFTFNVTSTGIHTFSIYMREDGTPIDKIELATNPSYTPSNIINSNKESIRLKSVSIHPNPVEDVLHVKFDTMNESIKKVDLYSFNGILVHSKKASKEENEIIVETYDLTSGIYIVRLTEGDKISEYKIIKK
ncbi:glycoside hydrolase family 9 protein [Aquimarina sp. U1-2]|uniref:Ig-like domain-containing protein n=1 Tax=Aquimarina sp. U1-2 TaxID=2823141 RepID=UPI001AECE830|nr:Ig-like domain-containing protein [Aquimarina sp. U1-2]MBP2832882.1 glycoside hydrolase family 9 protein [Aquimarina sp. U1-2]